MPCGRKQLRINSDQMLPGTQAKVKEGVTYSKLNSWRCSVPKIRQERVTPLRHAVQNGTYKVANRQIAQSLQQDFFVAFCREAVIAGKNMR